MPVIPPISTSGNECLLSHTIDGFLTESDICSRGLRSKPDLWVEVVKGKIKILSSWVMIIFPLSSLLPWHIEGDHYLAQGPIIFITSTLSATWEKIGPWERETKCTDLDAYAQEWTTLSHPKLELGH